MRHFEAYWSSLCKYLTHSLFVRSNKLNACFSPRLKWTESTFLLLASGSFLACNCVRGAESFPFFSFITKEKMAAMSRTKMMSPPTTEPITTSGKCWSRKASNTVSFSSLLFVSIVLFVSIFSCNILCSGEEMRMVEEDDCSGSEVGVGTGESTETDCKERMFKYYISTTGDSRITNKWMRSGQNSHRVRKTD